MKNIVTIGGGTGSYRVLMGLKNIPGFSVSAIVSMADDGGSTGILRREMKVSPPGDVRQCIAALCPDKLMHDLLKHRFTEGNLVGHVFGNIFLATLEKITGDFNKAVEITSQLFKIKGKVIPVTNDNAELEVLLRSGEKIEGESKIDARKLKIKEVDKIFYKQKVKISSNARQAILNADFLIVCPGDFYTSIAPNLIAEGFKEVLSEKKVEIVALVNINSEEIADYRSALEQYLGKKIDHIKTFPPAKEDPIRHDPAQIKSYISEIIKNS